MNKSASIRVGIIGCGEIATERHLPVWKKLGVPVVAITDINENKAKMTAKMFHIPKYYLDYKDMIEKEKNLEIIDICTPIKFHKEHTIEACKNGKHVVVEKPMARTSIECQEMIDAAKRNGVNLTVCHTMRFYRAMQRAKELLDRGDIGEVAMLHIINTYQEAVVQPWVLSQGGVLWEIGIHSVYLTLFLMGDVEKVRIRVYDETDPQQNMEVIFNTEKGMGIFHLLKAQGDIEEIAIYGSKKRIIFPPPLAFDTMVVEEFPYYTFSMKWLDVYKSKVSINMRLLKEMTRKGIEYLYKGLAVTPHYTLLNQFIKSINEEGDVPVTPEEGMKTVKILEEIEEVINRFKA